MVWNKRVRQRKRKKEGEENREGERRENKVSP
jgi:hypothetical protein